MRKKHSKTSDPTAGSPRLLAVLRGSLSDAELHRRAAQNRSEWESARGFDCLTLDLQKAIALTANHD